MMIRRRSIRWALVGATAILLGLSLGSAFAGEETPAAGDDAAALAEKLQNPVAALISVPFQNNFE